MVCGCRAVCMQPSPGNIGPGLIVNTAAWSVAPCSAVEPASAQASGHPRERAPRGRLAARGGPALSVLRAVISLPSKGAALLPRPPATCQGNALPFSCHHHTVCHVPRPGRRPTRNSLSSGSKGVFRLDFQLTSQITSFALGLGMCAFPGNTGIKNKPPKWCLRRRTDSPPAPEGARQAWIRILGPLPFRPTRLTLRNRDVGQAGARQPGSSRSAALSVSRSSCRALAPGHPPAHPQPRAASLGVRISDSRRRHFQMCSPKGRWMQSGFTPTGGCGEWGSFPWMAARSLLATKNHPVEPTRSHPND